MACGGTGDNISKTDSNHCVPDFHMDQDYSLPSSTLSNKQSGEDEITELLWQNNAPVAVHPPNPRSIPKSSSLIKSTAPPQPPPPPSTAAGGNHLYMAEDEMAAWLHYPLEEFYSELLYPNPTSAAAPPPTMLERPPENRVLPSQLSGTSQVSQATRGFPLFSRIVGGGAVQPPPARLSSGLTVVDSSATPSSGLTRLETEVAAPRVAAPRVAPPCPAESVVVTSTPAAILGEAGAEGAIASPSSSSATNSATATATATTTGETSTKKGRSEVVDRKRKSVEIEDSFAATTANTAALDPQNEDVELESGDEKRQSRGSSATKRTRAAEVHNLSERRRRDRINEKMRALQELIPRCNKSDKASMLDEAIEYLKSLQMQVQMMSMGCGMVPMMYPGMQQQYMPPMGMGMGMGMDMGMTRPVMPYAPVVPGTPLPTPAANIMPPLAPRLPVPAFTMPPVPAPLSVNQQPSVADSSSSPYTLQGSGMAPIPNMADPYQQYLVYQQMQMQMQMQAVQNQTLSQPGSSKPAPSKSEGDNEDDI